MALDEFYYLPAAGETELLVEFAGVVEAEDVFRLFGEELFGFGEKAKVVVAEEEVLEVAYEVGRGLNQLGSWALLLLLPFFAEFLGGFGDEEGGGEVGG